jgi:hypothetical protein
MKKLFTAVLTVVYLAVLMPAGIAVAQSTSCTGTPGTVGFLPASGNVTKNSSGNITVDVIVNPGGCEAGAADVTVKYNTSQLQFLPSDANTKYIDQGSEGNPSNYFKNNIAMNEVASGTIRMARYIDAGSTTYTTQSGTFARLVFKPLVATGQTVTLSFNNLGTTDDYTTIAGKAEGSDLLGINGSPSATLTIAEGTVATMSITSVTPSSGNKDLEQAVTIVGTGFGTTQGTVKFGANAKSITSWSDTQIVAVTPKYSSITVNTPVDVTVTVGSVTATKTGGYTYTVTTSGCETTEAGCYVPTSADDPYIASIRPTSGNKNISQEVEIFGGNFGYYNPDSSAVAVGIRGATVIDWSPNRIVAQIPAEPGITSRSTRTITVTRSDGKQAYFTGFTYVTGPLPSSGPETYMWLGLALLALGLTGLTWNKLQVKSVN